MKREGERIVSLTNCQINITLCRQLWCEITLNSGFVFTLKWLQFANLDFFSIAPSSHLSFVARFCFCSFSSLCSRDSWVLCSRMQSIEVFFGHHNRNAVCGISNSNQFYATNKNAKWTAMVANQIMCANAENVCEWNEKIELTSIVIEISWSFAADLIWFINNFFVVLTRTHRMQCE